MAAYPEMLRTAIKEANSSRRKLSFDLAERTGNQQASEYRALGKYLSVEEPELPNRERAAILAVLLGNHRLALVSDVQNRRQVRLEDIAEGVAEILDNQRDALELLRDALPAKREQRRGGAPKKTS